MTPVVNHASGDAVGTTMSTACLDGIRSSEAGDAICELHYPYRHAQGRFFKVLFLYRFAGLVLAKPAQV